MKIPKINWKYLTLAIVFGFVFSVVAVNFVFPSTTHTIKEKVKAWVQTHIIDSATVQKLIAMFKNNTETNVIVDGNTTGLTNPTLEELVELQVLEGDQVLEATLLPSTLDLSASPYFPKVGDQLSEGSCAAWAVTYYAYGYMEAKQYGWLNASTGNPNELLSPLFTYNKAAQTYINSAGKVVGMGSGLSGNVNVLSEWGASTMAAFPYNLKANGSHLLDFGSEAAMREGVMHRALGTVYVMNDANQMNNIKLALTNDCPVTIGMNAYMYTPGFKDGNKIISLAEYNTTSANHAQTIVGYDDSITDDGDVGAFKVVNSWGPSFGDKGYYWITYEAMKKICSKFMPVYIQDNKVHNPTLLANVEFLTAPSRDAPIKFNLLNNDTNAQVSSVSVWANTPANYSNYLPFPLYPSKLIYDISKMNSFGVGSNIKVQCTVGTGYTNGTNGVIKSFVVEKYAPKYVMNIPTSSVASGEVPKVTPGTSALFFIPGSVPVVIADTTAPVTSISLNGNIGPNGWYTGKVNFTLSAYDASGVSRTYYKFTGSSVWITYAGVVTIPEGNTTVQYYSTDMSGNTESVKSIPLSVDTLPPSGIASVGASYTVVLSGYDSGSGIGGIFYCMDNGTWIRYSMPIVLVGSHGLQFYTVDNAGIQSVTKTIYVG